MKSPQILLIGHQIIDYKKGPLYKQLESIDPPRKYNLILEAVGITDPDLYTHSNKYLAAGGMFITVGPHPHSFAEFGQLLHLLSATMRPRFLGGVKASWRLAVRLPDYHLSLTFGQHHQKAAFRRPRKIRQVCRRW